MKNTTPESDQPAHDNTKPIVCTIQATEVPDHIQVLERLRTTARAVERTPRGVSIHLPPSSDTVADARRFVQIEGRCCEFWGFAVDEDEAETVLRWDGPPETSPFMDQLVGYFNGTEPIGSLFSALQPGGQ